MSKPKIIEQNKNLSKYTKDVLAEVTAVHNQAQAQAKEARALGQELLARIKERDEKKALQKQMEQEETELMERIGQKTETAEFAEAASDTEPKADLTQPEEEKQFADEKESEESIEVEKQPIKEEADDSADVEQTPADKEIEEEITDIPAPESEAERPPNESEKGWEEKPEQQEQPEVKEESENREAQRTAQQSSIMNNRTDKTSRTEKTQPEKTQQKKERTDKKTAQQGRSQNRQAAKSSAPAYSASPAPSRQPQSRKDDRRKRDEDKNRRNKGIKEKGIIAEEEFRSRKKKKTDKKQQHSAPIEPIRVEKAVIVVDSISIKSFAEKTGKPVAEILKKLLLLGVMSTINSEIDFDTAELVASDFGIELEQKIEQTAEDVLFAEDTEDDEKDLVPRPPVVTIMGHVDHGKTSLLDAIRKTKVTAGEAGGITQHIGAYTININKRSITFLDTPGHEAFTAMRARGAQATDIAVLVVAADDGVMPQTIEAINHAKSAEVPIIVAINKIDKEGASPERIKQELTEYGLIAEDWGGDTVMVPVSAKTGQGLDNILEMILLVADMQELKANPNRLAKGTIIEARLDKGRGPVATVLVQNGTLKVQDTIVAGTAYGRVRAMLNDDGKPVRTAGPSKPVEVIGFSEVPDAGDVMYAVTQDKLSRQVVEERKDKIKAQKLKAQSKVSLDDLFSQIAEGNIKELGLVVKADVQGSVEAVKQSLEKLSNDEVRVRVIHGGVGAVTESDVMLASASNAIIIGFNVRHDASVTAAAEREKVDIRLYRVIYNAIEDITAAMKGMLAPEFREEVVGHAEVRQTFKVSSVGTIAGSYVLDGVIKRTSLVRVVRGGIVVFEGKLSSLKRFKDDAREVSSGYECGITIENFNDIKEEDVIEAYEMVEIER